MVHYMNITLNNISKSFGSLSVLKNLSLCFEEHKTSCIMGPSGCGKTTLLHILLGLHSIDSGEISGKIAKKVFDKWHKSHYNILA